MMLSPACSHRLLSLLNQALLKCKEEEKQLEDQLRQWRSLLDNWDSNHSEPLKLDDVASEPQEKHSSPEDLQEVEALNKALEKALRVRGTSKTDPSVHKAPSSVQAPSSNQVPVKALDKPALRGANPRTYQLKPPYKTIPDRRRVQKPREGASSSRSSRLTPPEPPAPKNGNVSKNEQLGTKMSATQPCTELVNPVSPPTATLSPENSQPQRRSTLKEKGATLKLPAEYQQAYMKSSRLWEKFYAIQDHLPASRPSFIQRLQTTFAPEAPRLSLLKIEEETKRLEREVRSWKQNVDSANNWQGPGPARLQNYQSLLLLEALQEEVAKYQSELQNLQLGRGESHLAQGPTRGFRWLPVGQSESAAENGWREPSETPLHSEKLESPCRRCCLQILSYPDRDALYNLLPATEEYRNWTEKLSINSTCLESVGCPSLYSPSPPILIYTHPSELCELTYSRLRVMELQQKIHLQKVFSAELLAEAESWSRSAPTSCLVLRAIYTQLCEGGDMFPVLVQDDS